MTTKTAAELFEELKDMVPRILETHIRNYPYDSKEDLLQEGYIALWEALLMQHSTQAYLAVVVRHRLYDAVRETAPISRYLYRRYEELQKVVDQLLQDGVPATDTNIAAAAGAPVEEVRRVLARREEQKASGAVLEYFDTEFVDNDAAFDIAALLQIFDKIKDWPHVEKLELWLQGYSLESIGARYGISKARTGFCVSALKKRIAEEFSVDV